MSRLLLIALTSTIAASAAPGQTGYRPSPLQLRVDRSFSSIEIGTSLTKARSRLKEERIGACHEGDGCDWLDRNKVRHWFWGDSPFDLWVVVKQVKATDFTGRPIPALGIGMVRSKAQVIAAARKFDRKLAIDCGKELQTGKMKLRSSCSATLNPGWISIDFDARGQLVEVRFDGYQFT